MLIRFKSLSISVVAALTVLSGCATPDVLVQEPVLPVSRATQNALFELPPPAQKLDVAVYKFEDVTGQFKPADGFQDLSRAVSQGGASILVKALQDAGNRKWFSVIERSNLSSLLQERKIITEMRSRYLGETKPDFNVLPPLRFAGILMEGGVIGYDSNTLTGGAGARLLGIGASAEYRQDTISVDLRAVSVKTGEIMASTVVHKTLISTGVSGGSFSFVDVDKILELEAGISTNEPGFIALTKAIEKAVHTLILEGADLNLWAFNDKDAARPLINAHRIALGRSPLPESTERQIAQKVDTKVDAQKTAAAAAPKKAVAAPKQPAPKKPAVAVQAAAKPEAKAAAAVSAAAKPAPKAPATVNVAAKPEEKAAVVTTTAPVKRPVVNETVTATVATQPIPTPNAEAVKAPKRTLPVTHRSERDPVPVNNNTENSTSAPAAVVTKVSP